MKRRFWLNPPKDPKTGETRRVLWLWLIPIILLVFALTFLIAPVLDQSWVRILPFFAATPGTDIGEIMADPGVRQSLVGAWWFLALFLVMGFFNIFGEEFLFRGALLPKMNGFFGKWDWVANGVLMGAYHWHQPWRIPGAVVVATLCFAFPAKRFRSTWMGLIPHSIQIPFLAFLILGLVLGLA